MGVRAGQCSGKGIHIGRDSGVRDSDIEICSSWAAQSSELEKGVKGVAAAFNTGDGVGSGAGSAHSSEVGVEENGASV